MDYTKLENQILIDFKGKYKVNVEEACFATGYIPKHIILDKTRNIHSYLVFGFQKKDKIVGRYFNTSENFENDMIELVKTQYSKLDRPLFILVKKESGELLSIEGNSVKEYFLNGGKKGLVKNFIESEAASFDEVVTKIREEL